MKIIVPLSGGKDSQATLLWATTDGGFGTNIIALFCDTGWEHEVTYAHIVETAAKCGVTLVTVRSKKYDGFVDLAKKKKRFPSSQRKFCTEELKIKPMIDYILDDVNDNCLILQGIRKDESDDRGKMESECTFFKHYFEPYGIDKKGKPKFYTYRKKDVAEFVKKFAADIIRPIFYWTATQTVAYTIEKGQKVNPLYYKGAKRVGCYPCILCTLPELSNIAENDPKYIDRLKDAEAEVGRTFFAPDDIPERYRSSVDPVSGKSITTADDMFRYLADKNNNVDMFQDAGVKVCKSHYSLCE